jgi:hypothetical protein
MFCSFCGASVPPGLSYCNRCGADLRSKENETTKRSTPSPNILVAGIVVVSTVGLFAVILLMVVMSDVLRSPGLINGFAVTAFFLLLLVDALFALLLLRSKKSPGETTNVAQLREAIRAELQAAQTSDFPEPAASVTDHTTRTLERVRRSGKN